MRYGLLFRGMQEANSNDLSLVCITESERHEEASRLNSLIFRALDGARLDETKGRWKGEDIVALCSELRNVRLNLKLPVNDADLPEMKYNPASAVGIYEKVVHQKELSMQLSKQSEMVRRLVFRRIQDIAGKVANQAAGRPRPLDVKQALIKRMCPKKYIYQGEKLMTSGGRSISTASVILNNVMGAAFGEYLDSAGTYRFLPLCDDDGWSVQGSSCGARLAAVYLGENSKYFTLGQCLLGGAADEMHLVPSLLEGGKLDVIAVDSAYSIGAVAALANAAEAKANQKCVMMMSRQKLAMVYLQREA